MSACACVQIKARQRIRLFASVNITAPRVDVLSLTIMSGVRYAFRDKWVPVATAWRVLRLRKEEPVSDMEGSCEYIE